MTDKKKPVSIEKWLEQNYNTPNGDLMRAQWPALMATLQQIVDDFIQVPISLTIYPKEK